MQAMIMIHSTETYAKEDTVLQLFVMEKHEDSLKDMWSVLSEEEWDSFSYR